MFAEIAVKLKVAVLIEMEISDVQVSFHVSGICFCR